MRPRGTPPRAVRRRPEGVRDSPNDRGTKMRLSRDRGRSGVTLGRRGPEAAGTPSTPSTRRLPRNSYSQLARPLGTPPRAARRRPKDVLKRQEEQMRLGRRVETAGAPRIPVYPWVAACGDSLDAIDATATKKCLLTLDGPSPAARTAARRSSRCRRKPRARSRR